MTMYGYEIRNEYGLGAAELYKTAYQDNPEDILEGVAVAGIAGFLRQLGDLAEFAVGIFHSLHEEITNTASRSQNIMLRVQQLEAELPMVEKDLFHHRYTDYALNEGTSWHPNLNTDSNIVTKEEMPPYVMEFYKQSRGPPQLFRLDKFDKAGAGACLKRHTDPSFFRVDLSTYGIITQGYQRETRSLKPMRELSSISTNIARSLKMPQIVPRKEMSTKDQNQDGDEIPIRHVKLKQKQFNSPLLSNMQDLIGTDSPAPESFSTSISNTSMELEKPNESFISVEKNKTNAFHKRLTSLGSLIHHNRNREDTSSSDEKDDDSPSSEFLSNSSTTQQNQTGSPPNQDTESGDNSDEYISDATASEVEFLDALTTTIVDSEMETDSEVIDKDNSSLVRIGSRKLSSERKEEKKDSTLLRSKSSSARDNRHETEQVPIKPVAGTDDATAPDSDGGVSKTMKETEPHYRTVSFNKVASKKVSYQENEFNPVTTNENGAKTVPKLQKDLFSHSLRHMAKQLLEFNHDLTEDEEEDVDSQDLEENEDELLFESEGFQESSVVKKGEFLIENVQNGNVTEISDLIAKDTETIETEINIFGNHVGEDQADLNFHGNELHGLQNIESIEIERSNASMEFGEHDVRLSLDVTKDGRKQDEISIDDTVTKNITNDRVSNNKMSGAENLQSIEMEMLDSGGKMHADETRVGKNVKETDETVMDSMVADNLTRDLHENERAETQNSTLVKEQELVESEADLGSHGMQHGEETYKVSGHGTVTKRLIKEEVFYNDMMDNQNLSSKEGDKLCKSEMHVGVHILQNEKNKTEKLIIEKVFDSDVSESENLNSNEEAVYESEMYVGLDGETSEAYELPVDDTETYELPVHGTVNKRMIKEEVIYNDMMDNQNLSSKEGDELCKSEMPVGAHILQNEKNKTEKLINEEVFDSDVSESENLNSNEKAVYKSEMYVGLDGETAETYELPVDDTETGYLVEPEECDSGIAEFQILNSIENEEELLENENEENLQENEMDVLSDGIQHACEIQTVHRVDDDLITTGAMPENLLQEQNAYHGDTTQILASLYSLDDKRTLFDNSTEPWDSHIDVGLSVEALVDHYELLEEDKRDSEIQPASSRPLIKDTILLEARQSNNEPVEKMNEENLQFIKDTILLEADERGELPVHQKVVEGEEAAEAESVNPVPVDPIKVFGTEIADETVTPAACNSDVTSAPAYPVMDDTELQDEVETAAACNSELNSVPADPVIDLDTEFQDEVRTAVACNSEVIPDRVIISPHIQRIAPTHTAAPEEGDTIPALPPLPPLQWRTGKHQMSPFPSLGPMTLPPNPSKFGILPSVSKLGRPPRPKSSRVVALERKMHDVENELIEENCKILSSTKENQNFLMLPSLTKDTSMKEFASVEKNPIETILRNEEALVRELSVKEEPLSTGDHKFEQKLREEEPRKKPPSVPEPPKYPMFQVTSHDNSMLKKAPTLIQPASRLITPSMLEEIKNKSCNLKPVIVKRPNFMGPYSKTNLKVAAMLEKANAIRQAVGSDDSDNDSWSE